MDRFVDLMISEWGVHPLWDGIRMQLIRDVWGRGWEEVVMKEAGFFLGCCRCVALVGQWGAGILAVQVSPVFGSPYGIIIE